MILARNEGRDYVNEGPEILAKAAADLHAAAARRWRPGRTSPSTTLDRHAGLRSDRSVAV